MLIALPAFYLLIALGLHSLAIRLQPAGNHVRQYLAVGTVAGLTLIIHIGGIPGLAVAAKLGIVLLYAFGCELYIFLFTFAASSVSVALLLSRASPDGRSDGKMDLHPERMVKQRLSTLCAAGLLQETEQGYLPTPHATRLIGVFRRLRDFFHHDHTR